MRFMLFLMLFLVGVVSQAFADDDQGGYGPDWPICENLKLDPNLRIDACTRLISGVKMTTQHLSWTYTNRGTAWARLNQNNQAWADFKKATEIDPNNPSPYFDRGQMMFNAGRWNEALKEYDALASIKSDAPVTFPFQCQRGMALLELHRTSEALQTANQELASDANSGCALYLKAGALEEDQHYDDALNAIDEFIRLQPGDPDGYCLRGEIQGYQGDNAAALQSFDTGLTIWPDSPCAHSKRGNFYMLIGDYKSAIADFTAVLPSYPINGYWWRAKAYFHNGEYQESADDCARVLEMQSNDNPCKGLLLRASMMLGNFDKAEAWADELVESGGFGYYALYRGAARFGAGDIEAAKKDFADYTGSNPDDPYGWLWLYLVDRIRGKDDIDKMKELAAHRDAWPTPLIRYIAGSATVEAVFAAADVPDAQIKRQRIAEANFYLGELANLKNDQVAAKKYFQAALDAGEATIDPLKWIPVYKSDDDLELALARAALGDGSL